MRKAAYLESEELNKLKQYFSVLVRPESKRPTQIGSSAASIISETVAKELTLWRHYPCPVATCIPPVVMPPACET